MPEDVNAAARCAGDRLDKHSFNVAWRSLLSRHTGILSDSGIWQGHSLCCALALLTAENAFSSWVASLPSLKSQLKCQPFKAALPEFSIHLETSLVGSFHIT